MRRADEPRRALSRAVMRRAARWGVLAVVSGALAGVSSFVFLEGLERVTQVRLDHGWLVWFLPVAGLAVGSVYHYLGGRSGEGNALLLDQIHEPTAWVPRRMAPLVLTGTWITHLFGGSAGREGTALQMSGSLSDLVARSLGMDRESRRVLLVVALAGGFGAVFGVPFAGTVFALEVQSIGRLRYVAFAPALIAALVGDAVVHGLGHHHAAYPTLEVALGVALVMKIAVAGIAFGLAGDLFVALTHALKQRMARWIAWQPLRPVLGGVGVVGLAVLFGRDYLGLSLPLIERSLSGEQLSLTVFALKLLFTAVTLGAGFPGGEVTPLFVIGSTLGSGLAGPLDVDVTLLAALGFVAVFAGAANAPLACTVMGVELFGAGAFVPLAVACAIAYVCSSRRGIYPTQRTHAAKLPRRVRRRQAGMA